MATFSSSILQNPGLTFRGMRSEATRELATRIDGTYMKALQNVAVREFWAPFVARGKLDPGEEIVKYPLDLEDLGAWQPRTGTRVARGAKDLLFAYGVVHPYYKDRTIPSNWALRSEYMDFPDRFAAMMISARRMEGLLFRDALFSTGTTGLLSKIYTYQGGMTGTQPLLYPSGHYCDPADPTVSYTFGNLHTGSDASASGKALAVKGALALTTANWETIRTEYRTRPGPGGVPLDAQPNFILGGARMEGAFRRLFGRALVLEDSAAKDASAATSNIWEQIAEKISGGDMMNGEQVVPVISGWLDQHPYAVANPTAQQYWTMSTAFPARPYAIAIGDGGGPRVKILDVGSEYEILNDAIYIKGDLDLGLVGMFPHIWDEWRST